jgi:hypothetical protein
MKELPKNWALEVTEELLNLISEKFENEELNNDSLVQFIEHCGNYLNLQTISNYSKSNKISYNGAKKFRNVVNLFNVKFIIDNE